MTEESTEDKIQAAKKAARRAGFMERFYFTHVPPLVVIAFLLDIELFTRISLVYTTTVSAITAGATYGAKRKAAEAEVAGYDN